MNRTLENLILDAKNAWDAERSSGRELIGVCIDTSSIARGAEDTLAKVREVIAAKNLNIDVRVVGSWGFNWLEPTVWVRSAAGTHAVLYGNVTADRVEDFVQRTVVDGGVMPELALGVIEGNSLDGVGLIEDHPWMQGQVRRLMANTGVIDPGNIQHYLANSGYEGFGKALDMVDEDIIKLVLDSGLGGRGGGGFPAGRKWDFLRNATADPRYLICNADEGDPGAWVNRILMEGDPHLIVEGMLIAALASNAAAGYIYIRYEYPLAVERMQNAVRDAYELGLLGQDILGTGRAFDLYIIKGAGSYVCGEETGLINSIDGYRGMPRIRPPFPAQAGLWNKPSNVNNVETYANAPMILRNGAEWWANVSDTKEKGTKMFTLSGQINQTCCIEIPWGPTVRDVLEHYGGGMEEGSVLKGYQPGGPLSGMLPASEADLTLTLDPYRERGMFLGSGGIVYFDQKTSVVDLCTFFLGFCEDESCGRCTTCHGGTQRAVEVLRRIGVGGGRESDIEKLEGLVKTLVWSNCLHGQFAMTTVKLALRYFRDEFDMVIREKRDPSQSLAGLISYRVTRPDDPGIQAAAAICPVNAFVEKDGKLQIDDDPCIRCGACKELAPNAIEIVDRFPARVTAEVTAAGG